jgi:hypothetical protein
MEFGIQFLILTLTSYAVTLLLTSSEVSVTTWHVFARERVIPRFPDWGPLHYLLNYFLQCRMCVGFWVSLGVTLIFRHPELFLPTYGASYFLATQERT